MPETSPFEYERKTEGYESFMCPCGATLTLSPDFGAPTFTCGPCRKAIRIVGPVQEKIRARLIKAPAVPPSAAWGLSEFHVQKSAYEQASRLSVGLIMGLVWRIVVPIVLFGAIALFARHLMHGTKTLSAADRKATIERLKDKLMNSDQLSDEQKKIMLAYLKDSGK